MLELPWGLKLFQIVLSRRAGKGELALKVIREAGGLLKPTLSFLKERSKAGTEAEGRLSPLNGPYLSPQCS